MKRLIRIVEDTRDERTIFLKELMEDYICKASEALKEFFKTARGKSQTFSAAYYAVEITDINLKDGTVEVGQIWTEEYELPDDRNDIMHFEEYLNDVVDFDYCLLNSEIRYGEIVDFMRTLENEGFEGVYIYNGGSHCNSDYTIFPFFRVE